MVLRIHNLRWRHAGSVALLTALPGCAAVDAKQSDTQRESRNRMLVESALERWRAGTGGPFELLSENADWTIAGSSWASKTYSGKEQFMAEVIRPFNSRMERPLRPTVREIRADCDTVVVLFDAESLCVDGHPYRNTYAWFMRMRDDLAVSVTAFFDTRLFDEMWSRVVPR